MSAKEDYIVSFSLELNTEKADKSLRKLLTILYRTIGIIEKFSGDKKLGAFIDRLQATIRLINQLRFVLRALQLLRMAMGDPFAWATAALTVTEVAMTIGAEMQMTQAAY